MPIKVYQIVSFTRTQLRFPRIHVMISITTGYHFDCEHCMVADEELDKMLKQHFPHIPIGWLERINRKLGLIKQENGGNVEMHTRWSGGNDQWTDWLQRDINPVNRMTKK